MLPAAVPGRGRPATRSASCAGCSACSRRRRAVRRLWALVVGFLFSCFPARCVASRCWCWFGEQGSGKTTLVPGAADADRPSQSRSYSRDAADRGRLVRQLRRPMAGSPTTTSRSLSQGWSDAFCRIATGPGYSEAQLYTDRGTSQFQVSRPQVLTLIVEFRPRPTCSTDRCWRRCPRSTRSAGQTRRGSWLPPSAWRRLPGAVARRGGGRATRSGRGRAERERRAWSG